MLRVVCGGMCPSKHLMMSVQYLSLHRSPAEIKERSSCPHNKLMRENADTRLHVDWSSSPKSGTHKASDISATLDTALLIGWESHSPPSPTARPANTLPASLPGSGRTTPSGSPLSQRELPAGPGLAFGYKRGRGGPACQMVCCCSVCQVERGMWNWEF